MALDIIKPEVKKEDEIKEDHGKVLMEWTFPEYEQYQRGKSWYITAGIVSILFLIYAIVTANYLFALIIIMVDLIILIQTNRKPDKVEFQITEEGIYIGDAFHSYSEINKFWIIYNPPKSKTLYLNYNSTLKPDITIPLENKNPLKVRDTLLEYLEEDLTKEDDSSSEQIRRFLKL